MADVRVLVLSAPVNFVMSTSPDITHRMSIAGNSTTTSSVSWIPTVVQTISVKRTVGSAGLFGQGQKSTVSVCIALLMAECRVSE